MADEAEVIDQEKLAPVEPSSHRDDINNDVAAAIASLKGEPVDTPADDQEQIEAKDQQRERGPDGKFIPKSAAPEVAAPQDTKSPPTGDTTKPSTEQPSTATGAAPVSWAADAKASWASLPPAIQNAVLKREQEFSTGIVQKSEQIRRFETALSPVAQEAQRNGMTTEQGIQRLVDGHRFLEQQPAQAILWLSQKHGIDLAELASNPPAPQRQVTADPQFAQVSQTVQSLQQRLDEMTQGQNLSLVEQFAASKDHPYYADVEADLLNLIPQIQAATPGLPPGQILQQAYERAIWLNPDVREKMIAGRQAQQTQARTAQIADKSRQASRAAVSVKGSSVTSIAPKKQYESNGDVYDDVRASIAQLTSA